MFKLFSKEGEQKDKDKDKEKEKERKNAGPRKSTQSREQICMVHVIKTNNTTNALLRRSPLASFTWVLEGFSWITEARTFYFISDVGEYLFVQLAYSNSGWPVQASCQTSFRYFDSRQAAEKDQCWLTVPLCRKKSKVGGKGSDAAKGLEGHVFECVNHSANKMRISPSRTSLQINDTTTCVVGPDPSEDSAGFCPHTAERSTASSSTKKTPGTALHVHYEGSTSSLNLVFEPECEVLSFVDGNITFGVDQNDGLVNMRFLPQGKATGTMRIAGGEERTFVGSGMCIHLFQGIRPNLIATRWNLAIFVSDSDDIGERFSLLMLQMSTPPTYGSATVNLGALYGEGRLIAVCKDSTVRSFAPALDPESGYYIPQEFAYLWSGVTIDGDAFTATCRVRPRVICARINVLDQLPFVMRKIVETFVTKPFVYQWVDRAEVEITISGNAAKAEGWLLQELSILSEES